MLTTAGNAGLITAENPLAKLPRLTGNAFCAMVMGSRDAPNTAWPAQSRNPCESSAPPANAATTTTVATQRRIFKLLLSMAVSPSSSLAGFYLYRCVRYVGATANMVFDVSETNMCFVRSSRYK